MGNVFVIDKDQSRYELLHKSLIENDHTIQYLQPNQMITSLLESGVVDMIIIHTDFLTDEILSWMENVGDAIPIIFLTDVFDEEEMRRLTAKGAYEYLLTSTNRASLVRMIDHAFDKRQLQKQQKLNEYYQHELQQKDKLLQQAHLRAEMVNKLRNSFHDMISHELRTPLTVIRGHTELLMNLSDKFTEEQKYDILRKMLLETDKQVSMVDNLLHLAQMQMYRFDLVMESCSITNLIEDIAERFEEKLKQRNIQLNLDFADDLKPIQGDRSKLGVIFINLLDNALKFTNDDGNILISARMMGRYAEIEVTDTGRGIPEDKLNLIFDAYYREDGLSSREYSGVGIGLAVVKEFVELHGGSIRVTSREGKGSSFVVVFPTITTEERIELPSQLIPSAKNKNRILIVEDDLATLDLIDMILSQTGYKTNKAANGKEAIEFLDTSQFDLVLLDLMLPDIDGLEICQRIRNNPVTKEMPVVILSAKGLGLHSEVESALKMGASDYIIKPFSYQDLLNRLAAYL